MVLNMKPWATKHSSHSEEKIELRVDAINKIQTSEINVLDAFHAEGELWKAVRERVTKTITITGIEVDKEKKSKEFVINGDNKKMLKVIDISVYDVIDLDAYTSPYEQIKAIHFNPTLKKGTVVIYTKIMNGMLFSKKLIEEIIPKAMIKKSPMYFGKYRDDAFYSFLNKLGVEEIKGYKIEDTMKKEYCYYIVK